MRLRRVTGTTLAHRSGPKGFSHSLGQLLPFEHYDDGQGRHPKFGLVDHQK